MKCAPSNDDSSDLEVEQIADIAMTALMTAVAESKDLPTSMSDPNGTMTAVELELEDVTFRLRSSTCPGK